MLCTKLRSLAWSIDLLRVIVISLGIYLLITCQSLWKHIYLLLIYYHILITTIETIILFKTLQVIGSRSNYSFLWILRTNIVILMSLLTCTSISSCTNSLVLIQELKLLRLQILIHSLSLLIIGNLDSSIRIAYIKRINFKNISS